MGLGSPVTLMCNVMEEKQRSYTYSWMHDGALLNSGTSPTLTFNVREFGTYICGVLSAFRTGRGNITLEEGGELILHTSVQSPRKWCECCTDSVGQGAMTPSKVLRLATWQPYINLCGVQGGWSMGSLLGMQFAV